MFSIFIDWLWLFKDIIYLMIFKCLQTKWLDKTAMSEYVSLDLIVVDDDLPNKSNEGQQFQLYVGFCGLAPGTHWFC